MTSSHAYPWGNPKKVRPVYDDAAKFKYVYPNERSSRADLSTLRGAAK